MLRLGLLRLGLLRLPLLRLHHEAMASDHEADQSNTVVAKVVEQPVVIGGRLKRPWAPILVGAENGGKPLVVDGKNFIALSGDDYDLGLFLFGAVNGPQGRNMAKLGIIRAVWKARIEAQEKALAELFRAEQNAVDEASTGAGVLSALWATSVYNGSEATSKSKGGLKGSAKKKANATMTKNLAKLPHTFEVTVPSSQVGVPTVTFLVLRADHNCLPSIQLSTEVLDTLWKECNAEFQTAAPSTPPDRKPKRRTSPMVRSPGSGSPRSHTKKARPASTYYRKRDSRMQARWTDAEGLTRTKTVKVDNPEDPEALAAAKRNALHYAKARQGTTTE